MAEQILKKHRAIWAHKRVLKTIYRDWYSEIARAVKPGKTLEIGGGSGNLKEYLPTIITSDIVPLPWLDLALDAHALPFPSESLSNIVLFDVLHHLENPATLLDELLRVLQAGGRAIFMEPYVSLASYFVYRFLHPEPLKLVQDPFELTEYSADRQPFDANQAIPTLIFFRFKDRFQSRYPNLKIKERKRIAFFAYPLSGGFEHRSLLPFRAVKPLLAMERFLSFLSPILAFRSFVVLEKG